MSDEIGVAALRTHLAKQKRGVRQLGSASFVTRTSGSGCSQLECGALRRLQQRDWRDPMQQDWRDPMQEWLWRDATQQLRMCCHCCCAAR
mmetsp:Transcript_57756/g.128875  ORF Transcript_57756/g.128875 Transcript_57756/m.128875 type:complete len:90 (+) Transcript_57756:293-562(+)